MKKIKKYFNSRIGKIVLVLMTVLSITMCMPIIAHAEEYQGRNIMIGGVYFDDSKFNILMNAYFEDNPNPNELGGIVRGDNHTGLWDMYGYVDETWQSYVRINPFSFYDNPTAAEFETMKSNPYFIKTPSFNSGGSAIHPDFIIGQNSGEKISIQANFYLANYNADKLFGTITRVTYKYIDTDTQVSSTKYVDYYVYNPVNYETPISMNFDVSFSFIPNLPEQNCTLEQITFWLCFEKYGCIDHSVTPNVYNPYNNIVFGINNPGVAVYIGPYNYGPTYQVPDMTNIKATQNMEGLLYDDTEVYKSSVLDFYNNSQYFLADFSLGVRTVGGLISDSINVIPYMESIINFALICGSFAFVLGIGYIAIKKGMK